MISYRCISSGRWRKLHILWVCGSCESCCVCVWW